MISVKQKKSVYTLITILLLVIVFCVQSGAIESNPSPKDVRSQQKSIAVKLTPEEKAWLEQDHLVRVRVGPWPPFMFTDNEIRGIAIDYLEMVFHLRDIRYQYVTERDVSWKAALENIRKHQLIDMVPTAKITAER